VNKDNKPLSETHTEIAKEAFGWEPKTVLAESHEKIAWVEQQRKLLKLKKLSGDKINKIDGLPIKFDWNPIETRFKGGYDELVLYLKENGSSYVPPNFVSKSGFKLGNWVSGVKSRYKKGILEKDKIVLFEKLAGWKWSRWSK